MEYYCHIWACLYMAAELRSLNSAVSIEFKSAYMALWVMNHLVSLLSILLAEKLFLKKGIVLLCLFTISAFLILYLFYNQFPIKHSLENIWLYYSPNSFNSAFSFFSTNYFIHFGNCLYSTLAIFAFFLMSCILDLFFFNIIFFVSAAILNDIFFSHLVYFRDYFYLYFNIYFSK